MANKQFLAVVSHAQSLLEKPHDNLNWREEENDAILQEAVDVMRERAIRYEKAEADLHAASGVFIAVAFISALGLCFSPIIAMVSVMALSMAGGGLCLARDACALRASRQLEEIRSLYAAPLEVRLLGDGSDHA